MVNEERVRQMTQMAIFEKENGAKYEPMLKYSRKDYVAIHGWQGFFTGSILYLLVFGAIMAQKVAANLDNLEVMDMLFSALVGLLIYAVYIIMHVHFCRRRAAREYKHGRAIVKELCGMYEDLEDMYESESKAVRPRIARRTRTSSKRDY